jgi:hypothetical protein
MIVDHECGEGGGGFSRRWFLTVVPHGTCECRGHGSACFLWWRDECSGNEHGCGDNEAYVCNGSGGVYHIE